MTALIPRAEIDTVLARHGDTWRPSGDRTVGEVRLVADDHRDWDAPGKNWHSGQTPEQHLAEADDLDALADRYEQEATA